MPCVITESSGCYLIEISRHETPLPFISVSIETPDERSQRLFVPALAHTTYLLESDTSGVQILCDALEVKRIRLRRISPLRRKLLLRRRSDRRYSMKFTSGVKLTPLLRAEGEEGKELQRALRLIANWGFSLTSANLQATPSLLLPRVNSTVIQNGINAEPAGEPRFAIVLHLYYQELWYEFEADLRQLRQSFHLIVTTTRADPSFEARIRNAFPSVEIHVFENRGRDVGPFLQLLNDGKLDAYPFICKLHGKRSGTSGPRALFGEVWRRTNVTDLIGTSDQVDKILNRFEAAPVIGMIGSSRFRLPNEFIQHHSAWSKNKDATLDLATAIGLTPQNVRLDFFAGTMFWARRSALARLRELNLTLNDFAVENGAVDGQLEHAIERLFGIALQKDNMLLDNAPMQ